MSLFHKRKENKVFFFFFLLRGFDQGPSKPVLLNWGRKCDFAPRGYLPISVDIFDGCNQSKSTARIEYVEARDVPQSTVQPHK